MSYLLDTNVVCETFRAHPEPRVVQWLEAVSSEELFVSVLTLGEIRKGIEQLGATPRKTKLVTWLEHEVPRWFGERILPIDASVADRWGYLMATADVPVPAVDGLIAATALVHNLKVVTRNAADFHLPGVEVINPWR
jgi:predicted nucleic acid-binding protein